MSRAPFFFLVIVLVFLGSISTYFRHVEIGIPIIPGKQIETWQVEAKIEFIGTSAPINAKLTLPKDVNFELVDEFTASPAYGVSVIRNENQAEVNWNKRAVQGRQILYYQGTYKKVSNVETAPDYNTLPVADILEEPYESAANAFFQTAYAKSGNEESLITEILNRLDTKDQEITLLKSQFGKTELFVHFMHKARIPAKLVKGLVLEDGRRNQQLVPLVKVFINEKWHTINVESHVVGEVEQVLIWQQDSPALLDLEGGRQSRVSFSIAHSMKEALQDSVDSSNKDDILGFSMYQLPIEEQNVFKGILLLPIGALVVVFLRVLVGLKCSGTFMPILIATSFTQTNLLNGLMGFLLIVSLGLMIRSYLSRLNLLLVSRISAVVMVVIAIILISTVLAFRLGITDALTIAFFPMVIMAWTIERMSILWEEEGGSEVLIQGGGSLIVAIIAYLMMDNMLIRHWAFNFLGVHLIILAAILMMGQYTGYRLLELYRFRPMARKH